MARKVTEFVSSRGALPDIPDDITLPQFILDSWHPTRPVSTKGNPMFIDDVTGRAVHLPEVHARTFGLANEMKSRWNVGNDQVVCIFASNHVDYPIAVWAVHRLGGIVTTANPNYTAEELVYQLQLTGACAVISHSGSIEVAEQACRNSGIPPDRLSVLDCPQGYAGTFPTIEDLVQAGISKHPQFVECRLAKGEGKAKIALLSFSSGTTGRPKAVAVPHYAVLANVVQMALHGRANAMDGASDQYQPGQVVLAVVPFYHIYGIIVLMHFYTFLGFTLVVMPRFTLEGMLASIQRHKINHIMVAPPMVVLLAKNPLVRAYDLTSVTLCMSGGAPLSAELTRQYCARLPHSAIGQAYGMTETATALTFPRIDMHVSTPGSGGQLLPGNRCRIVKADGTLATYNEPGELYVTGPTVTLGYYKNEEATRETFVHLDGTSARWVRTGDEVMFNERCEIFVTDRIKEIMKVRGFQVAPAELEGHLLKHPDVDDACVVGVPDEYSGELPLAFIVPSHDANERMKESSSEAEKVKRAIMKHVEDHKVYYKRLAGGVYFVDSIPKNPSGKLLRRFLRDTAKEIKTQESTKARL
ncbi:amp dependent CoA ligase [Phanerochaete sordida]|uniref:Amp dependent CoA ligase n=1 Tax=Phanerochaete sordida TaxID=48140 RepID=A0A9P3LH36_9APHY|nr:amp dependent CoA ligase [Phanerochaete sordida]